jgi:pimeloyl-ACP methyl ester carboxylesterase
VAYTSRANAADVDDLRTALGYPEWNLYGTSYGTRLALTVMRDYPNGVRSAVLDSICLPQADHYAELAASVERAFDLLFERCAASVTCAEAFPEMETVFYDLVAQADANPVTLKLNRPSTGESYDMVMNGNRLISSFFNLLYSAEAIPQLPDLIYELHEGHWDALANRIRWSQFMNDSLSEGMWLSVECGEEAPFSSPGAVETASERVLPRIREAMHFQPAFAMCEVWDAGEAQPLEREPVVSDVPTLILAGAFDPIHPPAWGEWAAETLSRAQFVEFPGFSHGALWAWVEGEACSRNIRGAFLADPTSTLDTSCLAALKPVFGID